MAFAGGASAKTGKAGGTLNVDLMSDVDFTDPALDYFQPGWAIEYATCLKLMNYPDKPSPDGTRVVPEAAARYPTVSLDGKTYTFTIKGGFSLQHQRAGHGRELRP